MSSDKAGHQWAADGRDSWVPQLPLVLTAFVVVLGAASASFGQTIWQVATGNWNTPGNWTLGVPNSASGTAFDAQIKNGGTAQLAATGASVRRMRVGVAAGGGQLEVNGGGLTVTDNFHLNEGGTGFASTTVQSGGIVTAPTTVVGYSSTGQSNFSVIGAGSRVNATASFVVADEGRGLLTLAEGGTLAVGNGTLPLDIATDAGSIGAVLIGNGGAPGVLQASAVRFGVGSGLLEFRHTGNLTFATPITGAAVSGTVHKTGSGTTTLSGTNSYIGATAISGGTLAISADVNLGTPPGTFKQDQIQFFGGTLRATQSFVMHFNRGIDFGSFGGTIEVDATRTLTHERDLDLSASIVSKTGAGTLEVENIRVGVFGSSTLLVTGGGTLAIGSNSFIGYAAGRNGSATISGPGTTWLTTDEITVGYAGNGTLEITSGGMLNNLGSGHIGRDIGSAGTVTVRGLGSAWNAGYNLIVGDDGEGTLNIEDRALVNVGETLYIPQGTVNLSGGTLRFDGYNRTGTFNFNSGTIQLAGNRNVGTDVAIADLFGVEPTIPTGKGLTVEGTTTLTTAITVDGGTFTVGRLVNPSNLQLNRGTLNVTNQALTIGAGGLFGSTLDLASDVTMNISLGTQNQGLVTGDGQLGGTFNNAIGGELRAEPGRSLKLTGSANANSGQINLLGGLVEFTQNLTNNAGGFISGNGSLIVRNGLTNNGTMNFSGTTNILGDTTNSAGGKIIAAAGGPTTFFDDVTNQGQIRTSVGSYTVFFGSVTGAGTFAGPGAVNFEGDLKPGNSAAAVQFAGDVALGSDAALRIELGGKALGSQYDHIRVSGDLSLDGSLIVSLFNNFAPTIGQSFNILDWGTLSGTFSLLTLPAIPGLTWNTSQLYTTGVLSIAAGGLAGDYNGNGIVDAADYTVWRNNLGDPTEVDLHGNGNGSGVTVSDFTWWKTHYGDTAPANGSSLVASLQVAVPEPASLLLLAFACSGIGLLEKRRRI
jgi:T5SS/PEP-CTERM-associated repeat protein/autotransporter-associated beta strand protein